MGGIADRPNNMADVFHTLFGVAGWLACRLRELQTYITPFPRIIPSRLS